MNYFSQFKIPAIQNQGTEKVSSQSSHQCILDPFLTSLWFLKIVAIPWFVATWPNHCLFMTFIFLFVSLNKYPNFLCFSLTMISVTNVVPTWSKMISKLRPSSTHKYLYQKTKKDYILIFTVNMSLLETPRNLFIYVDFNNLFWHGNLHIAERYKIYKYTIKISSGNINSVP